MMVIEVLVVVRVDGGWRPGERQVRGKKSCQCRKSWDLYVVVGTLFAGIEQRERLRLLLMAIDQG